jgi:hypothetical protein
MKRATIENFDSFISDPPQDIAELNPCNQAPTTLNDPISWVAESGKNPLRKVALKHSLRSW